MERPAERLKHLRTVMFDSAADACEHFGWPVGTYRSHENGNREISRRAAAIYASAFQVSAGYILFGEPNDSTGNVTDLSQENRQPNRPHFIEQIAVLRGLSQAELARAIGADKSVVSRWYNGATPSPSWQIKLSTLFKCDRVALFEGPDEGWFREFLNGRSREEIDRIKATLETAFPRKIS